MSNPSYSVYKHTCPNGKVYIGITSQKVESRWNYGHGYDLQLFGRAIKKYGWENIRHEVLFDGLTLEEANEAEKQAIEEYNSMNKAYGYNCTQGGDGCLGHEVTIATREKMRRSAKRTWSNPEVRERLLEHLHELNSSRRGTKMCEETVRKRTKALMKPVSKYTKDGEYIETYESATEAARAMGVECNSLIITCCKGKKKTAYGFIWKYKGELLSQEEIAYRNSANYHEVPIEMCTDDWTPIEAFAGFHAAERETGFSYKAIFSACQTKRRAYGYRWRYAETTT